MMTVQSATELVRRLQAGLALVNQEELLEYVALSLTETEFDELCEDFQRYEHRPSGHQTIKGVMYILGMPVLIRALREP
jgi:hypothetical protein